MISIGRYVGLGSGDKLLTKKFVIQGWNEIELNRKFSENIHFTKMGSFYSHPEESIECPQPNRDDLYKSEDYITQYNWYYDNVLYSDEQPTSTKETREAEERR